MEIYNYEKLCDPGRLEQEIIASSISSAFYDHIETVSSPETTRVYFREALSAQDETTLDGLISAHVNEPIPDIRTVVIDQPKDENDYPIYAQPPAWPVYGFHSLIKSGGSRVMTVDGGSTPVDFTFAPSEGEVWQVERLLFGMDDVGLLDFSLFGGLPALANGILITVKTDGIVYTIATIKDNADVAMIFPGLVSAASGVLDAADGIYGALPFQQPIQLSHARGDYIRMSIRDRLSGINLLRAMVVARRMV